MQTILLIRGKGAEIITQDEKITQEGQLEAFNQLTPYLVLRMENKICH